MDRDLGVLSNAPNPRLGNQATHSVGGGPLLFLIWILGWTYYLLPHCLRQALGFFLGFLLRIFGLRSQVVKKNLEIAWGGDLEKRKQLYSQAYFHLGQLIFELFMLVGPLKRYVKKQVIVQGIENWQAAHALGKGVFFVSSHVGNWEIMSAKSQEKGMDLLLVTKKIKPAWLHAAIEKGRARCGVKATYEPRTLRDILAHLKNKGTVGFVLDQYTGPPVSVRAPLFGLPVGTSTALATLAVRSGAPVLPVLNYRNGQGKFVIEIGPPVETQPQQSQENDLNLEIASLTAAYVSVLETHIRAHPEQWLWTHHRFKGDLSPLRPGEWSEKRGR